MKPVWASWSPRPSPEGQPAFEARFRGAAAFLAPAAFFVPLAFLFADDVVLLTRLAVPAAFLVVRALLAVAVVSRSARR